MCVVRAGCMGVCVVREGVYVCVRVRECEGERERERDKSVVVTELGNCVW